MTDSIHSTHIPTGEQIALSVADIKAMKIADNVVFRAREGYCRIEAHLKKSANLAFDDYRHINTRALYRDYTRGEKIPFEDTYCFEMIQLSRIDECWQSIVSIMRPGDELQLEWSRSGRSQYIEVDISEGIAPHYVGDSLDIKIIRLKKTFTFHVETQYGPDNSARMIRKRKD